MVLKNPFIAFEHDVYALTRQGQEELRGGGTSLSAADLELLVRADGRATVAQIAASMQALPAQAVAQACVRLARAGLLDLATNLQDDSLDFTDFFSDKPRAAPSQEELARAKAEASTGVSSLKEQGYYVCIARRRILPHLPAIGGGRSAIVVEDDPQLGALLKACLESEGFSVRLAANRNEVLSALREPPLPDIVLLDVVLPDIDGFDVLLRMRQHQALKSVAVVMVTSQATREAVLKGLARGAEGYITKPVEPATLIKAVLAVLGVQEGPRVK